MADYVNTFVFSFRREFESPILDGVKCQTIRPNRKDGRMPRAGDRVKLFTGMRTPQCKRLGIAEVTDCFPVYMDLEPGYPIITARGVRLNVREMEEFAAADGFPSVIAMREWFRKTYSYQDSFHGFCVRWKDLKAGPRRVAK